MNPIQQEQTEGTESEKKSPLGRLVFHFLIVAAAAWIGYLCSQQPKVWFDRQWAGLALYKGGYRSWTLSFCDGFTIPPGSYTNGIAKMVPVTIDKQTGKMRFGYHWPKYSHSDIRGFLLKLNGDATIGFTNGLDWGNAAITATNSPEPEKSAHAIEGAIFKDTDTGNLWKFENGRWIEFIPKPMPKDRPPRQPRHVDADGNFFNPPDNPRTPLFNDALYITNGWSVGTNMIVTFVVMTNVCFTTNLPIIWEPPRQLVPQRRAVLNAADNFENPPENL